MIGQKIRIVAKDVPADYLKVVGRTDPIEPGLYACCRECWEVIVPVMVKRINDSCEVEWTTETIPANMLM